MNDFLIVPRQVIEDVLSINVPKTQKALDSFREILKQPAEQHQSEPVGTLLIDEYFDGREVGDVDVQLDTKACEQLAEKYPGQSLPLYICPAPADLGEVERLRGIIRTHEKTVQEQADHLAYMRANLTEAHALLRKVRDRLQEEYWDQYAGLDETRELIDAALSASAERNQCDGCQVGIPLVKGSHCMGKPGGYADTMSCQAGKYVSAEPSTPKCGACGQGVQACNDGGCHYLRDGNGAPVERDERAEFESWVATRKVCTHKGAKLRKDRAGNYLDYRINDRWLTWQARAALERKP